MKLPRKQQANINSKVNFYIKDESKKDESEKDESEKDESKKDEIKEGRKVEFYIPEYMYWDENENENDNEMKWSHDFPDPFDGSYWFQYFDEKVTEPWKGRDSYKKVIDLMNDVWIEELVKNLGIKEGDKILFVSTDNACLASLTRELFERKVKIEGIKTESVISNKPAPTIDTHFPELGNAALFGDETEDYNKYIKYAKPLEERKMKSPDYVISFSKQITEDIKKQD